MRSLHGLRGTIGIALAAILSLVGPVPTRAQAPLQPGISYQGHLEKNDLAYNGVSDFKFRLFDSEGGGAQIGGDLNFISVQVDEGVFNVTLDFGTNAFPGEARWLEIEAKTAGDGGFTLLTPRQPLLAAPYAAYAMAGPGVTSPWTQEGTDLTYSAGGVGVTGASSPYSHGKGLFIEGGSAAMAHLFGFDYDTWQPVNLILNNAGGRVGLGTTAPSGKFQVNSSSETAILGYGPGISVLGISTGNDGLFGQSSAAFKSGTVGVSSHAQGYGGWFQNNAGGVALRVNGKAQVNTIEILGGADIVEGFDTGEHALEPGTVVVIDEKRPGKLRASSSVYDSRVAGVVSGAGGIAPGLRLGQEGVMDGDTPVAMSGRVYARCSAENGPIRPGDLLTTAGDTGHAMRASDPGRSHGAVVGKAMSSLERGTGLVLVLVNLQ